MNRSLEEEIEALEQATVSDARTMTESTTDSETVALGEVWTSFGQLLPPTDDVVDEQRLLEQVRARLGRRRRMIWLARAAAVLMGIGLAWFVLAPVTRPFDPAPMAGNSSLSTDEPAATGSGSETLALWDDGLDEQFLQVRKQVWEVDRNWGRGSSSAAVLQPRIDQLEIEIEQSSL